MKPVSEDLRRSMLLPFGLHQGQIDSDVIKDVIVFPLVKLLPRVPDLRTFDALVLEEPESASYSRPPPTNT
jgi:hypothetical protein